MFNGCPIYTRTYFHLDSYGLSVNLSKNGCTVKNPANRLLAGIYKKSNIYPAKFIFTVPAAQIVIEPTAEELEERLDKPLLVPTDKVDFIFDVMRWHQRLGHLNVADVRNLTRNYALGINLNEDNADCTACIHGKQHKLPFKTGRTCAYR